MDSGDGTRARARVGCPIRRSWAHSLLAAPPGLSQRATSFLASWRQGIHQMPFSPSTPQRQPHPVKPDGLPGTPAASAQRSQEGIHGRSWGDQGNNTHSTSFLDRSVVDHDGTTLIPMPNGPHPKDGKTKKRVPGRTCQRPPTHEERLGPKTNASRCPPTGLSSPPHDVQRARKPPPPKPKAGRGAFAPQGRRAAGPRPSSPRPTPKREGGGLGGPGPT